MAIMGKRVSLGAQKMKKIPNKPNKKITKKKTFIKKVVDYLKSDCYYFASLVSSSPNYRSLKGIYIKEKDKKESKKKLVKKLGEYLMSNCYMYSPLLLVPSEPIHISPRETRLFIKSVTSVELVRHSISVKGKNDLANEMKQIHKPTDNISKNDIKGKECLVHVETVKNTIYGKCRPLKTSEKG